MRLDEATVDHPGEITWHRGEGPLPVIGPCPHADCPHESGRVVADGPDTTRYVLVRCEDAQGCNGACRAWQTWNAWASSEWLHVGERR